MRHPITALAAAAILGGVLFGSASAQTLTSPREAFGFDIGADYSLINYTQAQSYWRMIDEQSDRVQVVSIGQSAEGREQIMAIVSSPANLANLDRYRDIARRLARAEDLDEDQARALAREGKSVVWIDGALHSTETVGAQQLTQLLYELARENDIEISEILDNVIVLLTYANPDGMELVSNWYMRNADPERREMDSIPVLYQKYTGHDNNRDFYMSNMPESENINRILYREWFPQIVFNHHQPGPRGTVVFVPPFRDPYNYNLDPLVITGLDSVGAAITARLIEEGRPGVGRRSTATYSNWTNGTLRATALFHNSIGILTEIIGSPTPFNLPLIPAQQLPRNDLPAPVEPQLWRFHQSIEYSISMNRAVLTYASRNAETVQMHMYRMGRNAIERGQGDHWTITASDIERLNEAAAQPSTFQPEPSRAGTGSIATGAVDPALYQAILRNPDRRDPRGYVIPIDQVDAPRAAAFVNVLIKGGVDVLRATSDFSVGDETYRAGSFVVMTGQAYRAHILDMFEPQDHPDDFPYPGAAPTPPYDVSGYTVAYQMGVEFDRILDGFEGPFERIPDTIAPPPGQVRGDGDAGYLVSHEVNNSFVLQNRLLAAGKSVSWLTTSVTVDGRAFAPGALWVPAGDGVRELIEQGARDLGVDAHAMASAPSGEKLAIRPPRIGLVDRYGGVISSGWVRWVLEQNEFPFEIVYPQTIDGGDLIDRYDVLIFSNNVMNDRRENAEGIPAEYQGWLGQITPEQSIPQLEAFVRAGGSIVAIGNSTRLAQDLNLPVQSALAAAEASEEGAAEALPRNQFFIPGAILTNQVDPAHPLAYGMGDAVDVYFHNSPAFRIGAPSGGAVARPVAWFPGPDTLRSGWVWGQEHLDGAVSVVDVSLGRGRVFLMGPEVIQRAQSHGTYKFLFNALIYGPAARSGS